MCAPVEISRASSRASSTQRCAQIWIPNRVQPCSQNPNARYKTENLSGIRYGERKDDKQNAEMKHSCWPCQISAVPWPGRQVVSVICDMPCCCRPRLCNGCLSGKARQRRKGLGEEVTFHGDSRYFTYYCPEKTQCWVNKDWREAHHL